jgi:hypothetical protein
MPKSMSSALRVSQFGPPFHEQNIGPIRLKPPRASFCK